MKYCYSTSAGEWAQAGDEFQRLAGDVFVSSEEIEGLKVTVGWSGVEQFVFAEGARAEEYAALVEANAALSGMEPIAVFQQLRGGGLYGPHHWAKVCDLAEIIRQDHPVK